MGVGVGTGLIIAGALGAASTAATMLTADDPKSASDIKKKAGREAETKRLSRAAAMKSKGKTQYSSAPSMGMQNLKTKVGQ